MRRSFEKRKVKKLFRIKIVEQLTVLELTERSKNIEELTRRTLLELARKKLLQTSFFLKSEHLQQIQTGTKGPNIVQDFATVTIIENRKEAKMRRNFEEREEKKLFRIKIVEQLIDLESAERSKKIGELAQQTFNIPYSEKTTISRSSIYQWLKEYTESSRRDTMLMDKVRKDRGENKALTLVQQAAVIKWRLANPSRTVKQLREELLNYEETKEPSVPSESTISRFLRENNCSRKTLMALKKAKPSKKRLSFEAEYPQQIWQIDTKGPDITVVDPEDPTKTIVAKPIVIIDDHSRFIVGVLYVISETEAAVMNVVKSAIASYGIPETIYADLGSPYTGKSLERALRLLGSRIRHTEKGDPEAKGKVERIMQLITNHIEMEIRAIMTNCTIDLLQEITLAVLAQEYHRTIHSETGETPEARFFRLPSQYRRFVSDHALARIFLRCKKVTVTKTGIIRLEKQHFLVPTASLYNKQVITRYNPENLSKIYVWFEDEYHGEAFPYKADNDYQKRLEYQEQMAPTPDIVETLKSTPVPVYSRLDRVLAAYRNEYLNNELDVNSELKQARESGEMVKALLRGSSTEEKSTKEDTIADKLWDVSTCTHLLSVLLRRSFTSSERLSIDSAWRAFGPFSEALVRRTVGELLGKSHPTSDLIGYLEALHIAALTYREESKTNDK